MTKVHWADVVDEEDSQDTVASLVSILREKLRPTHLEQSRALTTGMALHSCPSLDSATCEQALALVRDEVPAELTVYFEEGSFYVQLS